MDSRNIPVSAHPAYTWVWNTDITREGIRAQLDEMYQRGIRAVYVLGEANNFRPERCRTRLSPDYLTDEYVDLVHYAYEYAKEKGMYTWLYNEGGFPSGMASGRIRAAHPELAIKAVAGRNAILPAGTAYTPADDVIAAFVNGERIRKSDSYAEDVTVREYIAVSGGDRNEIRTDNADRRNAEEFLRLTHEAYLRRFGDAMGTDITLMFDDEAYMGTWTADMEKIFYTRYGYDLCDYLPVIARECTPSTENEHRAYSDYIMLCGELVRENYFIPMRDWLRAHGMRSTGHLDRDNDTVGCVAVRYGNVMETLRAFDVPGIDVIWSQITYPAAGKSCSEGSEFFPRTASSAARQLGHNTAMSESFAVFGAHVTPEEMRYTINYQAVRGISLFNLMVVSYDRRSAMCHQYRPNFISENPGMDCLSQINSYTARLSHILQSCRADVRSALYCPYRTVSAGGEIMKKAAAAYDALGWELEKAGVDFDIIDEDFVAGAHLENGVLVGEHVRYENVFVPDVLTFEKPEILALLSQTKAEIIPAITRENPKLIARKLLVSPHEEAYFIVNTDGVSVSETVTLPTGRAPRELDLQTGEEWAMDWELADGCIRVPITLRRGEGIMILCGDARIMPRPRPVYKKIAELTDFEGWISREYTLIPTDDPTQGVQNTFFARGERPAQAEWAPAFSGEVTYETVLPAVPEGELMLDLGDVRHFAKVYLNGEKIAEATMPPYRVVLPRAAAGDSLTVVIANTIANVTRDAKFFDLQQQCDVGPYHVKMKEAEKSAPAGGWSGKIEIYG